MKPKDIRPAFPRITTKWLRKHDACEQDVALFKKVFGSNVPTLTVRDLKRADKVGLSLTWLFSALPHEECAGKNCWYCLVCKGQYKEAIALLKKQFRVISPKKAKP